jgi:(E)-4-hydroxy-3-methylbut-2-enyl-diphosphate synthase
MNAFVKWPPACADRKIPIRIGVNSGSLEKDLLKKYGGPTPQALAESALYHVSLLEKFQFDDIVISIKSSDVNRMIQANELVASQCNYPLHLGVTEAGSERMGIIKSAIGIGSLLQRGIGDTIRVSLTADPVREVETGIDLLKALSLRGGIRIVSCPTCGRTRINLIPIVEEVEKRLAGKQKDLTVALMGCAVNGPGEAREADIGIAGGDGVGLIFKKGEIVRRVPEDKLVETLLQEIDQM